MRSNENMKNIFNPHATNIVLAHGGGGQLTDELISEVIQPALANPLLNTLDDAAILDLNTNSKGGKLAFTTDSYVVHPLVFPGGDIGKLAVSGTVNDLAVCGAQPIALSLGFIIEEGFAIESLKQILKSIAEEANKAGVHIATGDTKVVAKGQADGLYINTSGIGIIPDDRNISISNIKPGDEVLISGTIADHGLAVMLQREDQDSIESDLKTDATPLNNLIEVLFGELGSNLVFMRDPTRGGVAGVVSDLAEDSGYRLTIDEVEIPMRPETHYAADMLGLDPLDVANEGKIIIVVRNGNAHRALEIMRTHVDGKNAAIIGKFEDEQDGLCELVTDVGGRRIIQKPYGEQLPRIC